MSETDKANHASSIHDGNGGLNTERKCGASSIRVLISPSLPHTSLYPARGRPVASSTKWLLEL